MTDSSISLQPRVFNVAWPAAALLLTLAAGAFDPASQARAEARVRNAEDLLVVDCLLPGQVRKLGAMSTFMSARRPVRTTQADCEIRGGEYVAYDRANYQTALKVWLGQAEAGDADAQNYVGEIYLKGLGTDPDYGRAAQWFEKSAAKGSKRAKINLGYLYESGQGVSQDLPKALNLYRDASGISGEELVFASSVNAQTQQTQAENRALREQISSEQQKSQQLRSKLEQLKQQLQQKQQSYEKTQHALNDVRVQLDVEQAKVGVDRDPQFAKLKSEMDARARALTEQQAKLDAERRTNAKQLADAEAKVAAMQAREQQAAQKPTSKDDKDMQALQASAAQMNAALGETRARSKQLEQQMAQLEQQRQTDQAQFDSARAALAEQRAQNEDSKKMLHLMDAQLAEKRQELARQREQMQALQEQVDAGKAGATASVASTSSSGALRVEILQPPLSLTRGGNKPAASVPAAQDGMDIVGRVLAPAGLAALDVNERTVSADNGGIFKTHITVASAGTPVHVSAQDKAGGKAVLDFMLVPGPGGKSATHASIGGDPAHALYPWAPWISQMSKPASTLRTVASRQTSIMPLMSLIDISIGVDEPGRGAAMGLGETPIHGLKPRAASLSSNGLKSFHGTSLDALRPACPN